MHLVIDGSLLPALFVLTFVVWGAGSYISELFNGARVVLRIVSAFALVLALIVVIMALLR